jgi:hypothetical protein
MARFMDFHEDLKLPAKTASPASKTSKPKAIGALRRLQKRPGLGRLRDPHLRYISP